MQVILFLTSFRRTCFLPRASTALGTPLLISHKKLTTLNENAATAIQKKCSHS